MADTTWKDVSLRFVETQRFAISFFILTGATRLFGFGFDELVALYRALSNGG